MASSLSSPVNNFAEGTHKIKCKYGNDNKNTKCAKLNIKIGSVILNLIIE